MAPQHHTSRDEYQANTTKALLALLFGALLVVNLAMVGCSGGGGGRACDTDADCLDGFECVANTTASTNSSSEDGATDSRFSELTEGCDLEGLCAAASCADNCDDSVECTQTCTQLFCGGEDCSPCLTTDLLECDESGGVRDTPNTPRDEGDSEANGDSDGGSRGICRRTSSGAAGEGGDTRTDGTDPIDEDTQRGEQSCSANGARSTPPCFCSPGFAEGTTEACGDIPYPPSETRHSHTFRTCLVDRNDQPTCGFASPVPLAEEGETSSACNAWCTTCCVGVGYDNSGLVIWACPASAEDCPDDPGLDDMRPCADYPSRFDGVLGERCDPEGGSNFACTTADNGYSVEARCDPDTCTWVGEFCDPDRSQPPECNTCIDGRSCGRQSIAGECGR